MKRYFHPAAATLLMAAPLIAQAAPTISGTVDVYLERTSVPGVHAIRLDSSGLGVSRLAFKDAEKLGGDLTATVYIESGLRADTGVAPGVPGEHFNRMRYIGLSTPTMKLQLGKQYSPHLLQLAGEYDIYATSFWATPYTIFAGASRYQLIPDAVLVELTPPRLKISMMWARRVDEVDTRPAGNQRFLSFLYDVGPTLRVGISTVSDQHFSYASPRAKVWLAGANFDNGTVRLSGGMQTLGFEHGVARINEFCFGAGYQFAPATVVQLNYSRSYRPGLAGQSARLYGVALVHDISKRTALYGAAGVLGNGRDSASGFNLPLSKGETARNLMLGIRHFF
jgi:predicted porin